MRIEDAGRGQSNAMVAPGGDLFYPDDHEDAMYLADVHEAWPVNPDRFPFHLAKPVVRARVTFTVEVLASMPIELSDSELSMWVSDRFGPVCDRGAWPVRTPTAHRPERVMYVNLGALEGGPVEWADGSAPEAGWHCPHCRHPKRADAGPCTKLVPFGGRDYPCGFDDADHHGPCSFKPGRVP